MAGEKLCDEIRNALTQHPDATTSKMFGASALKAHGKVFACFYKGRLVLKLRLDRLEDCRGQPADG